MALYYRRYKAEAAFNTSQELSIQEMDEVPAAHENGNSPNAQAGKSANLGSNYESKAKNAEKLSDTPKIELETKAGKMMRRTGR